MVVRGFGLVIVGGVGLVIGIGLWVGGGGRWIHRMRTWILCGLCRWSGFRMGRTVPPRYEPRGHKPVRSQQSSMVFHLVAHLFSASRPPVFDHTANARLPYPHLITTGVEKPWHRGTEGSILTSRITEIEVNGLFDLYDYRLQLPTEQGTEPASVALLYGDNGRGKTTILELLFHLLSSEPTRGHRTHIYHIPFQAFTSSFSDGARVSVSRPHGDTTGDYQYSIHPASGPDTEVTIHADPDTGGVGRASMRVEDIKELEHALTALNLELLYLADTRELQGDTIPRLSPELERRQLRHAFSEDRRTNATADNRERLNSALEAAILHVDRWLQTETISASSIGETDAQHSYATIVNTLAAPSTSHHSEPNESISDIQRALRSLEEQSAHLAAFGLMSTVDPTPFLEGIESADDTTQPLVIQVLRSFLDGQQSRLKALTPIYDHLSQFAQAVNSYFTGKSIRLHVSDGFQVLIHDYPLEPSALSSGEKHLLMLLLTLLVSKKRTPLFIIDEPELSLNVKWQRNLVNTLISLSGNPSSQFIMATHSIELLSQHLDYVVELNPRV